MKKIRVALMAIIVICLLAVISSHTKSLRADEGDNAAVDLQSTVPLTASDIDVSDISTSEATITWQTSDEATSQVCYDTVAHEEITGYAGSTDEDLSLVSSHNVNLSGLASNTTYHYRVYSRIPETELAAVSDDLTFTTSKGSSGGGGGGSGDDDYDLDTDLLGSEGSWSITSSGTLLETFTTTTPDGALSITLHDGSEALGPDGKRLENLSITEYEDPPDLPEGENIIGLPYDFQPDGATFSDPPLTLTWQYDPDTLGDIDESSLVLAFYDDVAGEWVKLESVVDTVNNTVTAEISHFTLFALFGEILEVTPTPAPADFTVSDLVISPDSVYVGESVDIEVIVSNTGGEEGTYEASFKINGDVAEVVAVILDPGEEQKVKYTTIAREIGTYNVEVSGLTGAFVVREAAEPVPEPFNWSPVVGTIIGVIIVGLAILVLVRRSSKGNR